MIELLLQQATITTSQVRQSPTYALAHAAIPTILVQIKMPLDTSTYSMALLRVDGRRWNELRRLNAQIRTQDAADGSSYLEIGHTKVMCVVTGPSEQQQQQRRGGQAAQRDTAAVNVNIIIAGFSSVDRKKRGRNDK